MELTLYEKCRKKRLTMQYTIVVFAVALFFSFVCQPLFLQGKSNILLSDSVFPVIWDVVMTAVNYAFYWISFAYVLYFISRFGLKNTLGVLCVYLGASVFIYSAGLFVNLAIYHEFSEFRLNDVLDILMYVGFDLLHMAVVVAIGWLLFTPKQQRAKQTYLLARKKNPDAELKMPQWMPFRSMLDFKNEMLRSAVLSSAVSAAIHIASRIIYDLFFGKPQGTADLLWVIFAYVSEVLAFVAGFFVIVLILSQVHITETVKKAKYDVSLEKMKNSSVEE